MWKCSPTDSQLAAEPSRPVLLGHVLAHEIGHILQGTDRHSETGLMKARWDSREIMAMDWKPLSFTADDVVLIRIGMATREAHLLASR